MWLLPGQTHWPGVGSASPGSWARGWAAPELPELSPPGAPSARLGRGHESPLHPGGISRSRSLESHSFGYCPPHAAVCLLLPPAGQPFPEGDVPPPRLAEHKLTTSSPNTESVSTHHLHMPPTGCNYQFTQTSLNWQQSSTPPPPVLPQRLQVKGGGVRGWGAPFTALPKQFQTEDEGGEMELWGPLMN